MSQQDYQSETDWAFVLALIAFIGVLVIVAYTIPMGLGTARAAGGDDKHGAGELAYWLKESPGNSLGGLVPLLGGDPHGFAYVKADGVASVKLVDLGSDDDIKGSLKVNHLGVFDSSGDVVNTLLAPGVLDIQLGKVTTVKLDTGAVTTDKLAVGAVTDQKASIASKPLVRLVSDTNMDPTKLYVGKIDGVTVADNNLVLLTNQTTKSQIGPWILSTTAAWSRPGWYTKTNTQQAFYGVTTEATEGDVYHGSRWYLSSPAAGTTVIIDTTATEWTRIESSPITAPLVIIGEETNALQVIPAVGGASNFVVDNATKGSDTGLKVESNVASSGVAISAVSTVANESLHVSSKGTADLVLQDATGATGSVVTKQPLEVETKNAKALTVNNAASASNVFEVDTSAAAGAMTGLKVTGGDATLTTGTKMTAISTAANSNLSLDALGTTGQLILQNAAVPSSTATSVVLVGPNMEFANGADKSISFGATSIAFTRSLQLLGNNSSGNAIPGGEVRLVGGKASGNSAGGAVSILGGDTAGTASTGGSIALIGGSTTVSGPGGSISLTASGGKSTGAGGAVTITTGTGVSATGGAFQVSTGTGAAGGPITMTAGVGASAQGGSITLIAGDGSGGASTGGDIKLTSGKGGASGTDAGNILFTASDAQNPGGAGGSVTVKAGQAAGGGLAGSVNITAGKGGSGTGGNTTILGGDAAADAQAGGAVSLQGGAGLTSGKGGAVGVFGGTTTTTGTGGAVVIIGGDSTGAGVGGDVSIDVGSHIGGTANGSILIGYGASRTPLVANVNQLGYISRIVTQSAAGALTAANSGCIINVTKLGAFQLDLPAVATSAGVNYKIVSSGTRTGVLTLHSVSGAVIFGGAFQVNKAASGTAVPTSYSFAGVTDLLMNATALVGDSIDIYSNGTNWIAWCQARDDAVFSS